MKLVLDKLFQNELKMDEWDQDMDGLKTTEQESVVDIDSLELCSVASTWHQSVCDCILSLLLVALDADQKNVFTTVCSWKREIQLVLGG